MNHGIRTGLDWKAPSARTVAYQLRGAGYQTAAFTENGYIMRPRGFGEGFASFSENKGDDRSARGLSRVTFGKAARWLA